MQRSLKTTQTGTTQTAQLGIGQKNLNRDSSLKKDIQMTNKHKKGCPTPFFQGIKNENELSYYWNSSIKS